MDDDIVVVASSPQPSKTSYLPLFTGERNISSSSEKLEPPLPTCRDMRQAITVLKRGLQGRNFDFCKVLKFEKEVEKTLDQSVKQSTIEKFFGKVQ